MHEIELHQYRIPKNNDLTDTRKIPTKQSNSNYDYVSIRFEKISKSSSPISNIHDTSIRSKVKYQIRVEFIVPNFQRQSQSMSCQKIYQIVVQVKSIVCNCQPRLGKYLVWKNI